MVAIDDDCSGKCLAFTKNNPPDFGLLFFSTVGTVFDSYWNWSNRTYPVSKQPTRASLPSTLRHLEVWFCWTSRVECSMGRIDLWPGQWASGWASEQTVNVKLRAHFYEKLTFNREVRDPLFDVCTPHISSKGPQPQFDCHVQTNFQKNFLQRTHSKMRKKTSASQSIQPQTSCNFEWSCMLFFFSLSKLSQSMKMVLAIRLFELRRRKDICSINAKLLRCTVYACEAALALGKSQQSGKPRRISQSAS